jgi:oligopeptide/dipeptide ABC transporter ATP-binding protein
MVRNSADQRRWRQHPIAVAACIAPGDACKVLSRQRHFETKTALHPGDKFGIATAEPAHPFLIARFLAPFENECSPTSGLCPPRQMPPGLSHTILRYIPERAVIVGVRVIRDILRAARVGQAAARMRARLCIAVLFISHNLDLVAEVATRVSVMYAGQVVESGPVQSLFTSPHHPYTRQLMRCIPRIDGGRERMQTIPGQPPQAGWLPRGCAFAPRCDVAEALLSADPIVGARNAVRIRLPGGPGAVPSGTGCCFAAGCRRKLGGVCDTTPPPWQHSSGAHRLARHIPLAGEAPPGAGSLP